MIEKHFIVFTQPTVSELQLPNNIGCSSLGFASESPVSESFVKWNHGISGQTLQGSYDKVIAEMSGISFVPRFFLVFGRTVAGLENFVNQVKARFPQTPIAGGAAAATAEGVTQLFPAAQKVVLFVSDDKDFQLKFENIYPILKADVEIKSSATCRVSEIKYGSDAQWMPAADVYRALQKEYGVAEDNFESIVLSDKSGRNVHSVIEGSCMATTADFTGIDKIDIRLSDKAALTTAAANLFSKENTAFFACAGIKSMFTKEHTTGKNSVAAFLYGEVGTFSNNPKVCGLSISYIEKIK